MRPILAAGLIAVVLGLAACGQKSQKAPPAPWEITSQATGHFCGMGLTEHPGPKGQIFVAGRKEPYWFSSVRDTIAFTKLPEEPKAVLAIYVNDMGKAANWEQPEPGTWIEAKRAWFVIDSRRLGGMDTKEAVPFGEEGKAKSFLAEHGGRLVRFEEIPDDYVFGGAGGVADTSNAVRKE